MYYKKGCVDIFPNYNLIIFFLKAAVVEGFVFYLNDKIIWNFLLLFLSFLLLKNWFMISVRLTSYGCTREVWRARGKRKSCSRR